MNALVEERIFIALQWSEGRNQTCLVSSIKLSWQTNNLFLNICQYTWKLYETWWGSWSLSDICSQSEQEVVTWDTSCPYSVLYTSKVTYYLLLLNILPTNEESKIDFCHCFPWFHGPLIIRCVTSNLPCTTIMVTWLWGTFIGSHLEAYNILALLELLLCEFPHISLSLFWAQTRDC